MVRQKKGQQRAEDDFPLRRLREAAGLSQEELAVRIETTSSTISRWERQRREPAMTRRQWRKFCEAVDLPFDELPEYLVEEIGGNSNAVDTPS